MIKRIIKKHADKIVTKIINHISSSAYFYVNYRLQLHNDYGPAIVGPTIGVEYWVNGAMHRLDGPAKEYPDGSIEWWVNGYKYDDHLEYLVASEYYRSILNAN